MEYREAWSSGKARPRWDPGPSHLQSQTLGELKERGNVSMKLGDLTSAVQLYSKAIATGKQDKAGPESMAVCYSNRSAAHLKKGDHAQACRSWCDCKWEMMHTPREPSSSTPIVQNPPHQDLLSRTWPHLYKPERELKRSTLKDPTNSSFRFSEW